MRKHVKLRPHVILDVNMHMKLDWNHSPERRFNDCQNSAAFWHLTWSCSSPELIDWTDLKIDPAIFTLRSPWMYDILDNYHVLIQCGAGEKPVGIQPTKTCTCSRCVLDIAISFLMSWTGWVCHLGASLPRRVACKNYTNMSTNTSNKQVSSHQQMGNLRTWSLRYCMCWVTS